MTLRCLALEERTVDQSRSSEEQDKGAPAPLSQRRRRVEGVVLESSLARAVGQGAAFQEEWRMKR